MKAGAKYRKLRRRVEAWDNPISDRFRRQKLEGGAKEPGSQPGTTTAKGTRR